MTKTCTTCAHMGYRRGKYMEEEYCTLTGKKCGRGKENCLAWKAREQKEPAGWWFFRALRK